MKKMPEQTNKTKAKKLTPKQRRFLKAYVENGGNASQAARDTLDCSEENASVSGSLMLGRLRAPITELMDAAGLTDAKLISLMANGLEADKSIVVGQGKAARLEVAPDHPTRKFMVELSMKVKGHLVQKVQHQGADGRPIGPVILPAIPVKAVEEPGALPPAPEPGAGDPARA